MGHELNDMARAVVITGGTSGIGLATALVFAAHGWRVGLVARSRAGLDAAEARLIEQGARVCTVVADVGDAAAMQAAADRMVAALGPLGAWVNAAGNGVFGRLDQVSPREFDQVTATTYSGTVNGVRAALRVMDPRRRAAVVNVCSAIAFRGLPGLSSYAGAKAAVTGFSQAVQAELYLAGSRVKLAVVYPPAVNTPFFAHAASHLPRPPRPAAPVYQPELVAEAVFLAALRRDTRVRVSFVTVLYDLGCRFVPGLTGLAVRRLGYEGQMTDLPAALASRDPSLFAPPSRVTGTRGPFPARGVSTQLWLSRHRQGVAAGLALLGMGLGLAMGLRSGRGTPRPPAPRSLSRPRR